MPPNLTPKSFEYNLVDILGEQVSFTKSGLFPGETAIVEFDTYYRPDAISDEDFSTLKRTMRIVFENRNKDLADTESGDLLNEKTTVPFPPCGKKEKSLVLASLLHRARLLRQQLYELGVLTPEQLKKKIEEITPGQNKPIQGEENLLARQHLLHLYKLQKFIDDYDEQQQCIHISEIAYKNIQLDLDDEKVKELLKQFVFFILQGHYPLKDYRDIEPKAPAVIASLEKNPLKEKFDPFLNTYKKSGSPFPPAIAKVLESIDLDPKAMTDEINYQVDLEKQEILKRIYLIIPKKDPFWTSVQDPTDISNIIETLRTQNEEWDDDIHRMEAKVADADGKIKACEQAKLALEARKQEMTTRITELEKELQNSSAGDATKDAMIKQLQEEKKTAEDDFNRRSEVLQKAITDCTAEKQTLQARINELERQAANVNAELDGLRQRVIDLENIKTQSEKDIVELKRQHQEALAKAQEEVTNKEAARAAAEASAKAAGEELATKETELANALLAVQAAEQTAQVTATRINDIERQMREQDEATQKIREDISAKTQEAEATMKQLRDCEARSQQISQELEALGQELAKKSGETDSLGQELEEANAKIQKLTTDLQAEETKARDLQIALDACEEQKKILSQTATTGENEAGRLAAELTVAQGQLADAKNTIGQLTANINKLQDKLRHEIGRTTTLQQKVGEQQGLLGTQASEIQGLQGTLQQTQGELQTMRSKAQTAEAKAEVAEAKVKQVSEESQKKLTGDISTIQKKCGEELEKTKQSFEKRLQQEKADLQNRLTEASSQQLQQERAKYEAQLQAQKQELEQKIAAATASSGEQSAALTAEKERLEQQLREANVASQQQQAALVQQKKECEAKLAASESAFENELAELKRQRNELQKRLTVLTASSAQEKGELQRALEQEKEELERRLRDISAALSEQQARFSQEKASLEQKLREAIDASSAQQAKLSQEKDDLKRRLQQTSNNSAAQAAEIERITEELNKKLEEATTASATEQAKISQEKADLQKRLQKASTDSATQQEEIQQRIQEVASLSAEVGELTRQKEEIEKNLKRATNTSRVSSSQTALLTRQKGELERRLQELSDSYTRDLTKEKTECDKKINDIETRFHEQKADLEDRINELERGLVALDKSCKEEVAELTQQKEDCEGRLAQQAAAYEAEIQRLKDEHEELNLAVQGQLQEILRQLEISSAISKERGEESIRQVGEIAELKKYKFEYDRLLQVVKQIASQLDTGSAVAVHVDSTIPSVDSLTAIIRRLATPPAKAASEAAQRQKTDSLLNICNIVFLTSFLWQLNFSPLPEKPEGTDDLSVHLFLKNKLAQSFFPHIFEGGTKPKAETWAEPASSTTTTTTTTSSVASSATPYSFRPGLYTDIENRSAGRTTKHEFGGHLQQESDIHRHLLNLFTKLSHALEKPSKSGKIEKLDEVDQTYLNMLMGKIEQLILDYKVLYKAPLFDLEKGFGSTMSSLLKVKQPFLQPDILNKFIVKEPTGAGSHTYKVVTKEEGTQDPSVLNYAVLYYSFLVVVRDFLNHIETTVASQCPLPDFLKKPKKSQS